MPSKKKSIFGGGAIVWGNGTVMAGVWPVVGGYRASLVEVKAPGVLGVAAMDRAHAASRASIPLEELVK